MSRYLFGPTDAELADLVDSKEKVELTPEQYDAVLYSKMQTQQTADRKKASAKDLMRNMPGANPLPHLKNKKPVLNAKKDHTGLLVGIGLALVAALIYMRRTKKGPSKVTYVGSPRGMR